MCYIDHDSEMSSHSHGSDTDSERIDSSEECSIYSDDDIRGGGADEVYDQRS